MADGWGEGDMGWGTAEGWAGLRLEAPGQSGWTTQTSASAWAADRYTCHLPGWETALLCPLELGVEWQGMRVPLEIRASLLWAQDLILIHLLR